MLLMLFTSAFGADGDIKTATVDGVTWTYTVVSEDSKTCKLGGIQSESYVTAIATTVTGAITTPTTLDGYKVIALGDRSFRDCEISSITISPGVIVVGEKAFMRCYNLITVSLPAGVTSIGEEAFSECPISSIVLPESLVRIGEQAFEHTKLTTITLPKNVAYLGNEDRIDDYDGSIIEEDDLYGDVFYGCNRLQEVKVSPENQAYADADGVLLTKDLKTVLFCPQAKDYATIPEGVEVIRSSSFAATQLTQLTLPSTLTTIEKWAFEDSNLPEITIPEGVQTIGNGAFFGCLSLRRVTFNAEHCSNFEYGNSPFSSLSIKDFVVGPAVRYLPDSIACHNSNLKTVTIGENVETIGATPFTDCPNMTTVHYNAINAAYNSPGSDYDYRTQTNFLFNSSQVNAINFGSQVAAIPNWFAGYLPSLTEVVIPDAVESLDQYTFVMCTGLEAVTLGAGMKAYEGFYYYGLDNNYESPALEHIYVSSNNANITIVDDVIYSKDMTAINYFPYYRSNEVYNVPTSLKSLAAITFRSRNNLRIINISHDVEIQFWDEAHKLLSPFDMCKGLVEVNVTNNSKYTSVGGVLYTKDKSALVYFPCASNFTSFTVPSSVKEIYPYAMRYTSNLKTLVIPDNVTGIGEFAISTSSSLTTVTIGNGLKVLPRSCFSTCSVLASVTLPESLQMISANAFYNCSALTTINLPASLKSIGKRAFYNTNLQSVNLPEGLLYIGPQVFYNAKLENVVIPQSVLYVGENAFYNTPWLQNYADAGNTLISNNVLLFMPMPSSTNVVTIPDGIRIIAGGALNAYQNTYYGYNYNNIAAVEVPGTVEAIGTNAFRTSSNWYNSLPDGLTYLDNTLYLAKNPENGNVTVNEGIKSIAGKAFDKSRDVTSVTLPSSLVTIGEDAFASTKIKSIRIPEGVRYVGYDAFAYCSELETVYMPSTVEVIDDYAFDSADVTSSLKEFHCAAVTPPLLSDCAFAYSGLNDVTNCKLYVPRQSVELYKNTPIWNQFRYILPEGTTTANGDIDGSGIVDVDDVNAMINLILLYDQYKDKYPGNADMDGSGIVDVDDVNALINIILGK